MDFGKCEGYGIESEAIRSRGSGSVWRILFGRRREAQKDFGGLVLGARLAIGAGRRRMENGTGLGGGTGGTGRDGWRMQLLKDAAAAGWGWRGWRV